MRIGPLCQSLGEDMGEHGKRHYALIEVNLRPVGGTQSEIATILRAIGGSSGGYGAQRPEEFLDPVPFQNIAMHRRAKMYK